MRYHIGRRPFALTCTLAMLLTLVAAVGSAQSIDPIVAIDSPAEGAHVSGVVQIAGWAAHTAAPMGTGVDGIDIYVDGPAGIGSLVGGVRPPNFVPRPDVGAVYGNQFTPSGYSVAWNAANLPEGVHRLFIYVHSTVSGWSLINRMVVSAAVPTKVFPLTVTVTGSGTGVLTDYRSGALFRKGMAAPTVQFYPAGTVVTLGATADQGSAFAQWDGDCSAPSGQGASGAGAANATTTNATCTITMTSAKSATATINASKVGLRVFPLTLIVRGTGVGTVSTGLGGAYARSGSFATVIPLIEGASIALAAKPGDGSTSDGFTQGCEGQPSLAGAIGRDAEHAAVASCTVVMSGPRTVKVSFSAIGGKKRARVRVAFGSSGGGSVNAVVSGKTWIFTRVREYEESSGEEGFHPSGEEGSTVSLTAVPDPGFKFVGWGGDDERSQSRVEVRLPNIGGATWSPTEPLVSMMSAFFRPEVDDVVPFTLAASPDLPTPTVTVRRAGAATPRFVFVRTSAFFVESLAPGSYEVDVVFPSDPGPVDAPGCASVTVLRLICSVPEPGGTVRITSSAAQRPRVPLRIVCGGTGRGQVTVRTGAGARIGILCPAAEAPTRGFVAVTYPEGSVDSVELNLAPHLGSVFAGCGGPGLLTSVSGEAGGTCSYTLSEPTTATLTVTFVESLAARYFPATIQFARTVGEGSVITEMPTREGVPTSVVDCFREALTSLAYSEASTSSDHRRPSVFLFPERTPGFVCLVPSHQTTQTWVKRPAVSPELVRTEAPVPLLGIDPSNLDVAFIKVPTLGTDTLAATGTTTVPADASTFVVTGWAVQHENFPDWLPRGDVDVDALDFYLDCQGCANGYLFRAIPNLPSPDVLQYWEANRGVWKVPSGSANARFSGVLDTSRLTPGKHTLHIGIHSIPTGWSWETRDIIFGSSTYTLTVTAVGNGLASGSVSSNPAGISTSRGPQTATFTAGTIVRLTALPSSTSIFAGWTGALACMGSSASTCTVTMNSNLNVTATFDWPTLTVTHAGTGAGSVTSTAVPLPPSTILINTSGGAGVSQSASFSVGTIVNLKASAAAGSTFAGFAPGSTCIGFPSDCTVFMNGHASVTATFNKTGGGVQAAIDTPATGSTVTGAVFIAGWAADTASTTGTGVDGVHVYLDGVAGTGQFLGASVYGGPRPDVATHLGDARYAPSAFRLPWNTTTTTAGTHTLYVYIHSLVSGWSFITRDVVVAAETQSSYTLTVTHTGSGSGSVTSSPGGIATSGGSGTTQTATITANQSVTVMVTPASGSVFTGWTTVSGSPGSCTGATTPCVFTMTANTSLQARFDSQASPQTHTLTVTHTGTGSGSVSSAPGSLATSGGTGTTQTATFAANQPLTLTVTPAAGSVFTGWTTVTGTAGSCTAGTTPCVLPMAATTSLQARFDAQAAPQTFALMVTHAGTGSGSATSAPAGIATTGGSGTIQTATYAAGTSVTLTAAPAVGSIFAGWSGGCSGTGTCTVTMSANQNVTATFTLQNYTLTVTHAGTGLGTVTSAPAGISTTGGTGVTQSISLPAGTLVTLTATASAGSAFGGWGGVGCAASPCSVTMNANVAVTATFTLQTFTLTVTKQGQGAGTVVSTPAGVNAPTVPVATFPANQNVTLSAIPAPGSLFEAWGGACATVPKTSPCIVTMTANLAATATFIVNPVP